jgi:hypothetical protein
MNPREESLMRALNSYNNNEFPSIRATARAHVVSESTLRSRINGTTNRRAAHAHEQRLSSQQGEFLIEWILEQEAQGFPPSYARAREMATRILQLNGDFQPLGKRWVSKFIKDHPRIRSIIGRPIEAARINGTHPDLIREFYQSYEEITRSYNIQPCNTWNMDEHGIALGVCVNSTVIGDASKRRSYVKSPEDREWVSIVETVSGTGGFIRPLVIFKGTAPQSTWFPVNTPNYQYTTSDNGWTTNAHGLHWLQTMFELETRPNPNVWRLLILDGHGSHTAIDFLWFCKQHKIYLLFLPAHASHVLQPLDLGVFAPLKSRYRSQIAALASLDDASPVKKQRFLTCYNLARQETFLPRLLRTGWKAAGIIPFNPLKGLQSSQIPASKPRAKTPPQQPIIPAFYTTPKSSRQVFHNTQFIRQIQGQRQALFEAYKKAGFVLDLLNTRNADLEHKTKQQQAQIEALTVKRRKKVPVNPNTKFANIENIIIAREAAQRTEQIEAKRATVFDVEQASRELQDQSYEACLIEFQI